MTPEIQELKRLAEAAMPSLSEMMVVEFAEFSSVRDQDGASIAQVRGGVPYFDKEVAAYIAAASPSTILALIEAVKRQGEALEWYETHVRDCRKITKDGDAARHALDKDGGERARAALKEKSDV